MMRKERDPDGYRIYGLGEWGEVGGLIFNNWEVKNISQDTSDYEYLSIGQDFGYNHDNAILTIAYKDGDLYILMNTIAMKKIHQKLLKMLRVNLIKK